MSSSSLAKSIQPESTKTGQTQSRFQLSSDMQIGIVLTVLGFLTFVPVIMLLDSCEMNIFQI